MSLYHQSNKKHKNESMGLFSGNYNKDHNM